MRAVLTLVGLGALALLPWMPPAARTVTQVLSAVVLGLGVCTWLVAQIPVRVLVTMARIFCVAGGMGCAWLSDRPQVGHWTFPLVALALLFLVALFEPTPRLDPKRQLWVVQRAVLLISVIALAVTVFPVLLHFKQFLPGAALGLFQIHKSREVFSLRASTEQVHGWAVRVCNPPPRRPSPVHRQTSMCRQLKEIPFMRELRTLHKYDPADRYARRMDICLRYPHLELARRLGFATAVGQGDWMMADKIASRAAEAGFSIGSPDNEVLSQIVDRLGPGWQGILREDDVRAILAGEAGGPNTLIERWRQDPAFTELEASVLS